MFLFFLYLFRFSVRICECVNVLWNMLTDTSKIGRIWNFTSRNSFKSRFSVVFNKDFIIKISTEHWHFLSIITSKEPRFRLISKTYCYSFFLKKLCLWSICDRLNLTALDTLPFPKRSFVDSNLNVYNINSWSIYTHFSFFRQCFIERILRV